MQGPGFEPQTPPKKKKNKLESINLCSTDKC